MASTALDILFKKARGWCLGVGMGEKQFFERWSAEYSVVMAGEPERVKHREYAKAARWRDIENHRAKGRASYARHAEARRKSAKEAREQRKISPERHAAYNKYCREKIKQRAAVDINFHLTRKLRTRIFMSLKRGVSKASSTVDLIGCTIPEFKAYIESKWTEGMSWETYGKFGWHLDHIKPCASFDLSIPEQQKACFHYTNIQPLWWMDNLSKGDRIK